MKRHLNSLYVTSQRSYLSKEGETVLVRVGNEQALKIPIHTLEAIVCFGNVLCSPFLLGLCGERGVHVSFLTEHGRFLARVEGPISGNVLLRREQYRQADDDEASTQIARNIVIAKLANCRTVVLRALRDHAATEGACRLQQTERALTRHLREAQQAASVDRLRGLEGGAGREYFGCFEALVVQQREAFPFGGRSRRPPLDPVNALLSFLYTLLVHDVTAALAAAGLDPQVGFLHRDRPGRPSLALDLMEELRPFLADRLTLSLINRQQIQTKDFATQESGAVFLTAAGRKKVLVAYQKRKDDVVTHPYLGEKTTLGLLPHLQALLLVTTYLTNHCLTRQTQWKEVPYEDDMAQWVQREYSKGEIDRAGTLLVPWWTRRSKAPDELGHAYGVIQNWRSAHAWPLNAFQMSLRTRTKQVEPEPIVAQRLKRFSSVMNKLAREPNMKLSQMQDLGGCRTIVSSVKKVDQLVGLYLGKLGLIRFGGHLPKGEYDVDHGGHEGQAGAAELHG